MCGILGIMSIRNKKVSPLSLNLLHHRGPDGSGEWMNIQGTAYMGHSRLAILEPSLAGHQPMHDKANIYTLIFNGEIYNHLELRSLLPGIEWRGNSDTETLLELLSARSLEALPLLKGMFAFALHDSRDNSMLLVRDRLGIKPLYLRNTQDAIGFSSEVRALLNTGEESFSKAALSEYLGFGHFPAFGEITEKISSLPAGGWLKIGSEGEIEKGKWWVSPERSPKKEYSRTKCIQRTNFLVTKAIEEHLISDVGVGAFLSGGIDSSIVALVAGKALGKNLKTFTVGFPEASFDERLIARKVAKQVGSEHNELEIHQDQCLDWVKQAVLSLDLPSVDAINTYIVSKAVRDTGLKVALSGLGGDELYGGYPAFGIVPLLNLFHKVPSFVKEKVVKLLPQKLEQKLGGIKDYSTSQLTLNLRRFTSVGNLKSLGLSDGTPSIPSHLDLGEMGMISWAELFGYTIPMLLRDSDQMSMAVGLEIRVPFLDHQLVEEALSLPQKYKKGKGVKPLLVEAFRKDLPSEVYNRRKQGFELPMDKWMREPLYDFTVEGVTAASDFLDLKEPLLQKEKFYKGHLHWTRLWMWSVLGHWLVQRQVQMEKFPVKVGAQESSILI